VCSLSSNPAKPFLEEFGDFYVFRVIRIIIS